MVYIGRWSVFTREQVHKQWIREKSVYDHVGYSQYYMATKEIGFFKINTNAAFVISSSVRLTVAKFALRIP